MASGAEFVKKHSEHESKKWRQFIKSQIFNRYRWETSKDIDNAFAYLLFCTYKIRSTFIHRKVFIENIKTLNHSSVQCVQCSVFSVQCFTSVCTPALTHARRRRRKESMILSTFSWEISSHAAPTSHSQKYKQLSPISFHAIYFRPNSYVLMCEWNKFWILNLSYSSWTGFWLWSKPRLILILFLGVATSCMTSTTSTDRSTLSTKNHTHNNITRHQGFLFRR